MNSHDQPLTTVYARSFSVARAIGPRLPDMQA
jgi:hypothetical protein